MQQSICTAAAILAGALLVLGQPAADKCRLEGTIFNGLTGQPLRKARLTLLPASNNGEPALGVTDAQGKYAFANLAPGTYLLSAVHDGYMGQNYGAKKPGEEQKGEPIELTAGSVKAAIDLRLTPLGSIMGFVRDEDGDPVRQVDVVVLTYGYGPSGKKLQVQSEMQTDALGEFRFFDLRPGTYYLRAKPMSAQSPGAGQMTAAYATVYYPNAQQQAGATAIEIAAGQELRGTDFVLHSIAVSFIRGRVIKPSGGDRCAANLEAGADEIQQSFGDMNDSFGVVTMISGDGIPEDAMGFPGRPVDKDGKFDFRNVPIGNHTLTGICVVGKQRYSMKMPVQLDAAGLENLELRPVGPSTITGQLRLEGESKSKLSDTRLSVGQQPGADMIFFGFNGDGEPFEGKPAEDGTFSFHNLTPEVYHLTARPPKDLYVKSVAIDGRDVQESGIDLRAGGMSIPVQVVLSANGGSIEGSVERGAGARVMLIPSDPQAPKTLNKMGMVGPDGHFSFPVVAPGRYKLFAWEDSDLSEGMFDPEFRKPFEGKGQAVEVAEKQKATAHPELIPKAEK